MVFLAQHFAALIQLAAVHSNIFVLRRLCHHDGFPRLQDDVIHFSKSGQETNDNGGGRAEPANGQCPLNHGRKAIAKWILLRQHFGCATAVIRPVTNFLFRDRINMELSALWKVHRLQLNYTVLLGTVCDMDTLVYCQTINLAELVINMSA